MIVLLSPAKSLNLDPVEQEQATQPRLLEKSIPLVKKLQRQSKKAIKELMHISDQLAAVNVERFRSFEVPFTPQNAKPSVLTFSGDVYTGLQADTFDDNDMKFAQIHLRILSGLYGILRPLDLMQAYRLEMGTALKVGRKNNLYQYWDTTITDLINQDLKNVSEKVVLNLASKEYFSAVKPDLLQGDLVQIDFKEERNGKLKVISFNAKKARGAMAHHIVKRRISTVDALRDLEINGYAYNNSLSSTQHLVFTK